MALINLLSFLFAIGLLLLSVDCSGREPQQLEHVYCQYKLREIIRIAREYFPNAKARAANCGPDAELCQTCCDMLTFSGWRRNDTTFPTPEWTSCGGPTAPDRVCVKTSNDPENPMRCKSINDGDFPQNRSMEQNQIFDFNNFFSD